MKKIILAIALLASAPVFAIEVRSIRTSFEFIEIGSTQAQVQDKLGRSESTHNYVLRDRGNRPRAATDLRYTVNNERYVVTIVNGKVYKIEWVR